MPPHQSFDTLTPLEETAVHLLRRSYDRLSSTTTDLIRRATPAAPATATPTPWQPCPGCSNPKSVNNKFFFALFAILGVGLVLGAIWFFGFAKHGGFHYEDGDFEDYKTVILRRKGPDGKSLPSSKSTRIGWDEEDRKFEKLRWAAMSVVAKDEKGRKGILAKRGPLGTHSYTYRDDFTSYDGPSRAQEMEEAGSLPDWGRAPSPSKKKKSKSRTMPGAFDLDLEAGRKTGHHGWRYKDRDVTSYQREKVAKVGGMNRSADGSHFDFSGSEVSSNAGGRDRTHQHVRAEKRAADEAERMERHWRREAQKAAADLRREHHVGSRTNSPTKRASPGLQRGGPSRTPSPQKRAGREYSFSRPEGFGGDVGGGSYMDAYRTNR